MSDAPMSDLPNLTPEQIAEMIKSPCSEPCDKGEESPKNPPLAAKMLKNSFLNALDLCFDAVMDEPKKILLVGGCRQRAFAQHLALALPATEITLFDPDEDIVLHTKETICCRFQFGTGPTEQMAFPDEAFDITFAHNLGEFTNHWDQAIDELVRVTRRDGNLMVSYHQPALWGLFGSLPGMKAGLAELGVTLPRTLPEENALLQHLQLHGRIDTRLTPFPWKMVMSTLKPVREEKLALAAS